MNNNQSNELNNKIFTIPNILSAFRILLIPVFYFLYLVEKDYLTATLIILLSGLTDVVDGYIARNFNQVSKIGKVLDPTADKLTQAAIVIALSIRFKYMMIVFIVLAVKEAIMLVLGVVLFKHTKIIIGSFWHGKLAAFIFYAMLLLHLIWSIGSDIPNIVSYTSVIIAVSFMNFTLIMYSIDYFKLYKQHNILKQKPSTLK